MTCKQMGGPCDEAFHGETADEVIKADDQHLKDKVAEGDQTHKPALEEMQGRWKNPAGGMEWYKQMQENFESLPED